MLKYNEAQKTYNELNEQINKLSHNDKIEFTKELNIASITYAHTRALEALQPEDPNRTARHNAVIIALNMLEKVIEQSGGNNDWRNTIGRDTYGESRKLQGDFACYIAYELAIENR